ncbi:hypothetical protein QR77_06270 [Streptomyces sp. 150FB]|nr:hypothetical protein QR77_06270 [Streptomyces sp. 150FB]
MEQRRSEDRGAADTKKLPSSSPSGDGELDGSGMALAARTPGRAVTWGLSAVRSSDQPSVGPSDTSSEATG